MTEPVDTEKDVPDGFFLTSNVNPLLAVASPQTLRGSLRRLYMLIKVPVLCNLVLLIYPLYGPWKSLKSPWIWFWQMDKNPEMDGTCTCVRICLWKVRLLNHITWKMITEFPHLPTLDSSSTVRCNWMFCTVSVVCKLCFHSFVSMVFTCSQFPHIF